MAEAAKLWLLQLKERLPSGADVIQTLRRVSWQRTVLLPCAFLSVAWYTKSYFQSAQRPFLSYQANPSNQALIDSCSVLRERYWPSFLFYTMHASTLASIYLRSLPHVAYRRETLKLDDGGQLCIDWVTGEDGSAGEELDHQPTVIIFHGLNGGSNEVYVRHVIKAIQAKLRGKVRIVVMNNRGAGGSELLTPKAYCGAYTEDARVAISHVRKVIGEHSPLFGIGYSLGANILVKYLGEEGEETPLNGAVSISNPLDFKASSYYLEKMPLYNAVLTKGCIRTFSKHAHIFSLNEELELEAIYNCRRLRDFDASFTCKIFGYRTVDEYYDAASSVNYIKGVRVPTLILNAMDDPLIPPASMDNPRKEAEGNPHTIVATVPCGGHVGFPEGWLPVGNKMSWADRVVAEFIHALIQGAQRDLPM